MSPSRRWPTPALPTRYEPQLATLVKEPPAGDEWLHEIKFDGYQFGARIDRGQVKLITRRGHDWTDKLPHLARALAKVNAQQTLLDGEVAVVQEDGKTSFHALQEALSGSDEGRKIIPVYFVFDVLFLDGNDTSKMRTEDRKAQAKYLVQPLGGESVIKYSDHVFGQGAAFFASARKLGVEGIVSKLRAASYRPGRATDWLKTKIARRQEFVICGYIDRAGSADQVGSLILGVRSGAGRGAQWVFCGQVGTGFTQEAARHLLARLKGLSAARYPFPEEPELDAHRWSRRAGPAVPRWVRPELVCEVAFTEWTPDGTLRHPSFQGLREDKDAKDVVREG